MFLLFQLSIFIASVINQPIPNRNRNQIGFAIQQTKITHLCMYRQPNNNDSKLHNTPTDKPTTTPTPPRSYATRSHDRIHTQRI